MREAKLLKIEAIDPEQIDVSGRKRPVSQASVDSIIASFRELGVIKDEILVRQLAHQGKKLRLIAGLHRLEAFRQMGLKVPAKVYDCTDDWAALMELDDNLAGASLTTLDKAVFLVSRKAIFEKVHPEKRRGIAGAKARWDATGEAPVASFIASAATAMGVSETTIYRLVAAASVLSDDDIEALRVAPRQVSRDDLSVIAKIGDPDERAAVVEALAEGRKATAARKAYLAAKNGAAPSVKDPAEDGFKALIALWGRVPKASKRRFAGHFAAELQELIDQAHGEGQE